jgi:acyl carrier protein
MNFEQFCQLVSEISKVPVGEVKDNSSFRDNLGIDSLQMVNLFIHISEVFGVGVEVIERTDDMKTVGNLYRALNRGKVK